MLSQAGLTILVQEVHIHRTTEEAATVMSHVTVFNVLNISHCRYWTSPKRRQTSLL